MSFSNSVEIRKQSKHTFWECGTLQYFEDTNLDLNPLNSNQLMVEKSPKPRELPPWMRGRRATHIDTQRNNDVAACSSGRSSSLVAVALFKTSKTLYNNIHYLFTPQSHTGGDKTTMGQTDKRHGNHLRNTASQTTTRHHTNTLLLREGSVLPKDTTVLSVGVGIDLPHFCHCLTVNCNVMTSYSFHISLIVFPWMYYCLSVSSL